MFLMLIEIVNSASLSGNIYDIGLDKVKDVIVEIDTVPLQRVVAKDGTYIFNTILPGNYQIKAYTSDKRIETIEDITIENEGNYTFDIFLIPELESKEENILIWPYILGFIFIVLIIIFLLLKFRKKEEVIDKDLDYIINIIKKEGNRIIQRDLVQKTGLSEAKISLMITDLENKGIVRKIKKGRANIIILNK